MKLYADENFPVDVIVELRRLGHDCLTVFEDGRANQRVSDENVLRRATELDRAVLTINRIDFKRLHSRDDHHAGIVICTFDSDFAGQAQRIDTALSSKSSLDGQLVRVNRSS